MEEETQSSHQCAEHKGAGNSVYHQQSLQKSTAMKWEQFPCFGRKLGNNKGVFRTGTISSRITSVVPPGWAGGVCRPCPGHSPCSSVPCLSLPTSALNSTLPAGTLQGPLSAAEVLWMLLLWVVFPARLNPFIAKWALQKCLELGHSIEEKYFNLQRAPPLSLFIFFPFLEWLTAHKFLLIPKKFRRQRNSL